MKIWKSFSGEHSAKLRIIASFKTTEDAKKAEDLFNHLLQVEDKYSKTPNVTGKSYSDEMLKFLMDNNFSIAPNDIEQLEYSYPLEAIGKKIEVNTDDWAIHPLLQAMIHFGAKVEVYSKHDYPGL